jgi:hypothetical protein
MNARWFGIQPLFIQAIALFCSCSLQRQESFLSLLVSSLLSTTASFVPAPASQPLVSLT